MRKLLMALLIVLIPALANAWTLTVKVTNSTAGIAAGNKATVTIGTTSTDVTSGTSYFYPANTVPSASVAVTNLPNVASITLDNVSIGIASPILVTKGAASAHTLNIVYSVNQVRDITLTQGAGGLTSLKIGSSVSTIGFTGVPVGTGVEVDAQPNNGYRLVKITVNGQDDLTGAGSTSQVSKNFTVNGAFAPNTVSAVFEIVPSITATISVPPQAIVGAQISAVSSASSNVTPLVYTFSTSCSSESQTGASSTFLFTPVAVGACSVSVEVTHTATHATSGQKTASLSVSSASAADIYACTSCHAASNPQVVNDYLSSAHNNGSAQSTCSSCHTTSAHTSHINAATVSAASFKVVSSHLISGLNKGDTFCSVCHSPAIVTEFAASPHLVPAGAASCSFCHVRGVHNPSAACIDCHKPGNSLGLPWPPTGLQFHNSYTGTNLCTNCHALHNPAHITGAVGAYPHFSTFSTAQYVTRNISCDQCHTSAVNSSFNIYSANFQWARSGKANPRSPSYIGPGPYTEANLEASDFKLLGTPLPAKPANSTSQDCVRCHTTTGFISYVTPTNPADQNTAFSNIQAWGIAGDRTREMISCSACHNNTTGFDATFSRRSIGIETDPTFYPGVLSVAAWYGYSSAATKKIIRNKTYANLTGNNDSNICIACHTGKSAGDLIKLSGNCSSIPSIACRVGATGSFWSNVDFIDPHGMNAANLMFPDGLRAGYEYRAGTSTSPDHTNIGLDSTQGPCVGCHMSSPKKHSFSALSTASNGTIAAVTTNLCGTCHGSSTFPTDAATLQAKKEGYQAALAVIAAQLAAKGIYYNAAKAPYFFTTANLALQNSATRTVNWNFDSNLFQGANLLGAAFNLRLLQSDAGWVHNSKYSKRLLYDTIDYLDDGVQGNSVSNAIQNLGIDQTLKDKAAAYIIPRL